jgi:coiled-coil domain-containing protein 61
MAVFLTMLTSKSSTTNIDVLTLSELKSMKQKSSSKPHPSTSSSADSGRRYVILTYVGEFDKVHYPLPLKVAEDDLGPAETQVDLLRYEVNQKDEEIRRLTEDLAAARTSLESTEAAAVDSPPPPPHSGNVGDLKRKNASLRRKLTAMEAAFLEETKRNKKEIRELKASIASVSQESKGENKIEQLRRKLSSLSSALRKERENHSRTKNGATIKLTRLREELERVKSEVRMRRRGGGGEEGGGETATTTTNRNPFYRCSSQNESLQRGRKADRAKRERIGRSTTPRDRRRAGNNASYDRPTSASRSARSSARTPSTGGSSRRGGDSSKREARSRSNSSTRSAPRFDPTEYVREKARKEEERRKRRAWENSPARSVDSRGSRGSMRSVDSRGSRGSTRSAESRGRRERGAVKQSGGGKRGSKKKSRERKSDNCKNNENLAPPQIKNYARQQQSKGGKNEEVGENVQGEIKDINKRLQDLQTFINQANGGGKVA